MEYDAIRIWEAYRRGKEDGELRLSPEPPRVVRGTKTVEDETLSKFYFKGFRFGRNKGGSDGS